MSRAERRALQLLRDEDIGDAPVPVPEIAKRLGITISYQPFEGNISGMLFRDDERKVIGVNSSHTVTRQRFTIAHELGHLLLHKGRPLIIDQTVRINLRDARSSEASDEEEIEANAFAAALLMPREWVLNEAAGRAARRAFNNGGSVAERLADLFEVSPQAMGFRLTNLGIHLPQ